MKTPSQRRELDEVDGVKVGESPVAGLTLKHVLRGHWGRITRLAWSPDGRHLAAPSENKTVQIWDITDQSFHVLKTQGPVYSVGWSPDGKLVAVQDLDNRIVIKAIADGTANNYRVTLAPTQPVWALRWSPDGKRLVVDNFVWQFAIPGAPIKVPGIIPINVFDAAWSPDTKHLAYAIRNGAFIYDARSLRRTWKITSDDNLPSKREVHNLDWSPDGRLLAIGSTHSIEIVDVYALRKVVELQGATGEICSVSFSKDGSLLAVKSLDETVRIWRCDTWELVTSVFETNAPRSWLGGIAFHPLAPILATLAEQNTAIRIWDVNVELLLNRQPPVVSTKYTSAKLVLAGDSGVGKTGLGWRMAHGEFKDHPSTHGQQFWLLNELGKTREDGTQCEAILWDLAGQPDYRLTHALLIDDVDVALVVFDPTHGADPLHGVEFWLKQLKIKSEGGPPSILIAARCDRGSATLTEEELKEFCQSRGFRAYVATSALRGEGINELMSWVKELIPWDEKMATVTTDTFKRVKEYVLKLKENRDEKIIVDVDKLREGLQKTDAAWRFSNEELLTAVGHLENHGYVRRLRSSKGETRILLAPEVLNNLASSMVLEARRNPKGLGSLDERRLLEGQYSFRETEGLAESDRRILLDSAVLLFLEHNVCFRETDPLTVQSYLVFPDLINLKKPALSDEEPVEDGPSYTVSGAVQNLYASLVVLLGYTRQLTRTNQWQSQARYEVGNGLLCGFRAEPEHDGERDFVLYFGKSVGESVRKLFQSLFESFLARPNLTVTRLEPVACPKGHPLNRAVVRDFVLAGNKQAFCNKCGSQITLPTAEPLQLTKAQAETVAQERRVVAARTEFEQALFQLQTYVEQEGIKSPECFISYAWGKPEQENWVEHSLAADLKKAGIPVLLDRWDNFRIGASVSRFVERVQATERVLVVGTPEYRKKYDNKKPMGGYVLAAEGDLIGQRMLGSETEKEFVLPLLLVGDPESAFPPLLNGRVYADFRAGAGYFTTMFDLILSLYKIPFTDTAVADIRSSLRKVTQGDARER